MQLTEMIDIVQDRAELNSEDTAKKTLVAVAEALSEREMDGAQDNFAAQLPEEIATVVQSRDKNSREKYDADDFLTRVSEQLGTSGDETKTRVHAAFSAMVDGVSEGEQVDIVNALPNDLSSYAVWKA
jgi:uncharacterized protein (DUF2267 family)